MQALRVLAIGVIALAARAQGTRVAVVDELASGIVVAAAGIDITEEPPVAIRRRPWGNA